MQEGGPPPQLPLSVVAQCERAERRESGLASRPNEGGTSNIRNGAGPARSSGQTDCFPVRVLGAILGVGGGLHAPEALAYLSFNKQLFAEGASQLPQRQVGIWQMQRAHAADSPTIMV